MSTSIDITFLRQTPSISRSGFMAQGAHYPGVITHDPALMSGVIRQLYRDLRTNDTVVPPLINVFGFSPKETIDGIVIPWSTERCEKYLTSILDDYVAFQDIEGVDCYQLRPIELINYYRVTAM